MRKFAFALVLVTCAACSGALTPPLTTESAALREATHLPLVAPPGPRAQTIYFASNSNQLGEPELGRFPATANGTNVQPSNVIVGANTKMEIAATAFVDKYGAIWTCDVGYGRIEKFRAAAVGNVAPARTITGTQTQLNSVAGIALDAAGDIYVANAGGHDILVFAPTATGNAAPIRKIAGAKTLLKAPGSIAYDARTASVYVVDYADTAAGAPGALYVFPAAGHGNIAPLVGISGSHTGINRPIGIAVDPAGYMYVGNWPGWYEYPPSGNVTVFAPGAKGDVAPAQTIGGGPNTDLVYVGGLTVK